MILRKIYLYLDPDEFPKEVAIPFGFRSRYACNFLERRLKPLRFHSAGFNRIIIQGSALQTSVKIVKGSNAISSPVLFQIDHYEKLNNDDRHEFYLSMIERGLNTVSLHHPIPTPELTKAIDLFRNFGYKNEWTHQTKYYREDGLRASLLCRLTPDSFSLTLNVTQGREIIFENTILETKPDELIFADQFKSLERHKDSIIVRDKFGNIFYQTPNI